MLKIAQNGKFNFLKSRDTWISSEHSSLTYYIDIAVTSVQKQSVWPSAFYHSY